MPKSKLAKNKPSASVQRYLDISEVRDDVVILQDGSVRSVLLASSINFALKSEDEQNGIIQGYISFLNSINFPLQIVIQSRRLNIDKYLEDLKQKKEEQANELLRTQISEYYNFVNELVTLGDIMGKKFYIVVPYSPDKDTRKGFLAQLGAVFGPARMIKVSDSIFEKYKTKLQSRVDKVVSLLSSIGITAIPLGTQALIELLFSSYNPELSQIQKLPDEKNMRSV